MRKIGIVALACKLLVALWRYLEQGVIPADAQLEGRKIMYRMRLELGLSRRDQDCCEPFTGPQFGGLRPEHPVTSTVHSRDRPRR